MPKVSIHIDGGYFLKRLKSVRPDLNGSPEEVARALEYAVKGHLKHLNKIHKQKTPQSMLYRTFYYDAFPYDGATETPVSHVRLDYSKTDEAKFRTELFEILRQKRKFALRLGKVYRESKWRLTEAASKEIKNGTLLPENLEDRHFQFGLRQKGVDMRMGVDITSVTLKKQADIIVLLSGDSDFVPAAKLARREGIEIILDPMWRNVSPDLYEHIDGLHSGLWKRRDRDNGE